MAVLQEREVSTTVHTMKRHGSGSNAPAAKRPRLDLLTPCKTLFPQNTLPITFQTVHTASASPNVTVSYLVNVKHLLFLEYSIQVVVCRNQQKNRYFHLSGSLKKIGKYVGRGKKRSIANAVVENTSLRSEVVSALSKEAHKEIKKLCSDTHDSILRMTTKPALQQFTWNRVWHELRLNAPLIVSILSNLLPPSKREDKRVIPALCVCACIFLKLQNQKVYVVQTMISLVLKAGHATKQVWYDNSNGAHCISHTCTQIFTRLQKLQLCISYKAVLQTLDIASEGHDEQVVNWQDTLEENAITLQQQKVSAINMDIS